MLPAAPLDFPTELVLIADLHDHPRNYLTHPPDQIEHLMESIREHGVYANVVIAADNTLLRGHGVKLAAYRLGMRELPCYRVPYDPMDPRALKLLAGDNEVRHLAEVDDRALTELLKEIKDTDPVGLLGTGFDERMLANLLFVTRPASEIADHNEAAEWVGMPGYEVGEAPPKLVVSFRSEADRAAFVAHNDLGPAIGGNGATQSVWWPPKAKEDRASLRFVG